MNDVVGTKISEKSMLWGAGIPDSGIPELEALSEIFFVHGQMMAVDEKQLVDHAAEVGRSKIEVHIGLTALEELELIHKNWKTTGKIVPLAQFLDMFC